MTGLFSLFWLPPDALCILLLSQTTIPAMETNCGAPVQQESGRVVEKRVCMTDKPQRYVALLRGINVGGNSLSKNSLDNTRSFGSLATQKDMVNIGHQGFMQHWLTASVDGRGSTDPDGTIASYAWSWGDDQFDTGSTASPRSATRAAP